MKEENKPSIKENFHVYFKVYNNYLDIYFKDNKELQTKINSFLESADILEMMSENLELRKKYRNFIRVTKDEITFIIDIEEWTNFDKVALILLSNHPFTTKRSFVRKYGIDASKLRKVIFDKKDEIYTMDDDIIGLTHKGFYYIENKLSELMEI